MNDHQIQEWAEERVYLALSAADGQRLSIKGVAALMTTAFRMGQGAELAKSEQLENQQKQILELSEKLDRAVRGMEKAHAEIGAETIANAVTMLCERVDRLEQWRESLDRMPLPQIYPAGDERRASTEALDALSGQVEKQSEAADQQQLTPELFDQMFADAIYIVDGFPISQAMEDAADGKIISTREPPSDREVMRAFVAGLKACRIWPSIAKNLFR